MMLVTAMVVDLVPAEVKDVTVGKQTFLSIHAPSDSHLADRVSRGYIFNEATALFISDSCNTPAVVGNFKWPQVALDTTVNHMAKVCWSLSDFL
jgi:hypothetical protein